MRDRFLNPSGRRYRCSGSGTKAVEGDPRCPKCAKKLTPLASGKVRKHLPKRQGY